MARIFDVDPTLLIMNIAEDLEKKFKVEKPSWADFVKTGHAKERAPMQSNWLYIRMASILYRIFKDGPKGVERLRTYYGSKKNRGVKPSRFRKASGKIIRYCLQKLEEIGFLERGKKGRQITAKGMQYLYKKANEIYEKYYSSSNNAKEKQAAS